jgi:hypothetical protein
LSVAQPVQRGRGEGAWRWTGLIGHRRDEVVGVAAADAGDRGGGVDRRMDVADGDGEGLGRFPRALLEQALLGLVIQHPARNRKRGEHDQRAEQDGERKPRPTSPRTALGGIVTVGRGRRHA